MGTEDTCAARGLGLRAAQRKQLLDFLNAI
jgi:hypothetical protein